MDKKKIAILHKLFLLNWPYEAVRIMCLAQGYNTRILERLKQETTSSKLYKYFFHCVLIFKYFLAQSVACLITDACLTADPGVTSLIPARSHTFVEIGHERISTVILLPSAGLFKKGCCQLQAKVCAQFPG